MYVADNLSRTVNNIDDQSRVIRRQIKCTKRVLNRQIMRPYGLSAYLPMSGGTAYGANQGFPECSYIY